MNAPFPLGLPPPTAFYLTLFVVTLVIHVVFMNYVLAGSAYLAWASLFPGRDQQRCRGAVASVLRDWMPAALSAAITAGVAPLLFIQVLYKTDFYTANLLLFHRWMAILPVLIVGFYLAYVLKSKRVGQWPVTWRALIGLGAFACFAFVAWSWTENHVLSVQSQQVKTAFYQSDQWVYRNPHVAARLAGWFIGAAPTMCLLVAWQLAWSRRRGEAVGARAFATLRNLAVGSAVVAAAAAWLYFSVLLPEAGIDVRRMALVRPYAASAGAGGVLLLVGWVISGSIGRSAGLAMASAGTLLAIVGVTVMREGVRLQQIDPAALYAIHADAAQVGGLAVFLFFFALNAALIAGIFVLVRRGLRAGQPAAT